MKKNGLFILLILFLSGCQTVMMTLNEVEEYKPENPKSLIKAAKKFKFDDENIVAISSKNVESIKNTISGIPDADIFDAEGNCVDYQKNESACHSELFSFIPKLKKNGNFSINEKKKMQDLYSLLRSTDGKTLSPAPAADFYLFIYWSVSNDKLNKDCVREWERLARKNKKCHIEVIKVNIDSQEFWSSETPRDSMIIQNKNRR